MGQVAKNLIGMYPQVTSHLKPFLLQSLSNLVPKPSPIIDYFGPHQSDVSLSINLSIDRVIFVDNEDLASQMDLSGEFVGLDCE